MRLSLIEATRLCLLSNADAEMLKTNLRKDIKQIKSKFDAAARIKQSSKNNDSDVNNPNHPQTKLFTAIELISPGCAKIEVSGFVPGRTHYQCSQSESHGFVYAIYNPP